MFFQLKNKKINKTKCAPAQENFANAVSDMLRTEVINTEAKGSIVKKCFLPTEQYLLVYYAT